MAMKPTPAPRPAGVDAHGGAHSHPLRAAAWMIGAIVAFTSMAVAGRELAGRLDTFEIMLYRSLIGVALVVAVGTAGRRTHEFRTRKLRLHALRNVSHFAGQNLWFFAVGVVPLAQVFALEFTSPIWVMFMAVFVLKEPLTRIRLATAAFGFAGVLIVTRPWAAGLSPGILAAAAAAVGFAGSAVFTRRLTRTETILGILFWLTVMQAAMGLAMAGWDLDIAPPAGIDWAWLVLVGIAGLVAHFCLTTALSLAPAAVVTPIDFARLPLIALVGMLLYGEALDAPVLIGAAVIFAANYSNIVTETRSAARRLMARAGPGG